MSKMLDDLLSQGINLKNTSIGTHKTTCPKCSHLRKKKTDTCLWVNVKSEELALWKCHNCEWTGCAGNATSEPGYQPERKYEAPTPKDEKALPEAAVKFFRDRKISDQVVIANRIFWDGVSICYPYFVDGKMTNIKHRGKEKKFYMEKNALLSFYGFDEVKDQETIIIVEGEMDKLALNTCGFHNVVSVPNGAVKIKRTADKDGVEQGAQNTGALAYLAHAEALLTKAKKVILALDADEAGQALTEELARRIGLDKCWRVSWREKDANDTLIAHGIDATCYDIQAAAPYPVEGIHSIIDFEKSLVNYYDKGAARGTSTGWSNVDKLYTVRPGELTVVTGTPNSGKSEFIDALMINLAKDAEWTFAVFSPENGKEQHAAKLIEKVVGKSFSPNARAEDRMTELELGSGIAWAAGKFYFIFNENDEVTPDIDWILDRARIACIRFGIKGLVIDPYNEIEHKRPQNQTETEYVSELLRKVKTFARRHGVHVWMVAHPMKLRDEKDIPSLYDISGSANWANKADCGLVINRTKDASQTTEVHVKKIRFKEVGKQGKTTLTYNIKAGTYSVPVDDPTKANKATYSAHTAPAQGSMLDEEENPF